MTGRRLAVAAATGALALAAWWSLYARDEGPPPQEEIGGLVWERYLGKAAEKAEASGKPLLAVFRCPP